jgi:hypothetical protein
MARLTLFLIALTIVLLGSVLAQAQNGNFLCLRSLNCTSDEPSSPGDPFNPNNPENPRNPGGPGPETTASLGEKPACGSDLGGLRRVRAAAIDAVKDTDAVEVIPLCIGKPLGSTQEDVAELHEPISEQPVLMGPLKEKGYDASQVVGVVVNRPQIVLYVH